MDFAQSKVIVIISYKAIFRVENKPESNLRAQRNINTSCLFYIKDDCEITAFAIDDEERLQNIYDAYIARVHKTISENHPLESKMGYLTIPQVKETFDQFLALDSRINLQIIYWSVLSSVLEDHKLSFNCRKLKDMLRSPECKYQLDSLELSSEEQKVLRQKREEYITLKRCMKAIELIYEGIKQENWKVTMIRMSLLYNCLKRIEVTLKDLMF